MMRNGVQRWLFITPKIVHIVYLLHDNLNALIWKWCSFPIRAAYTPNIRKHCSKWTHSYSTVGFRIIRNSWHSSYQPLGHAFNSALEMNSHCCVTEYLFGECRVLVNEIEFRGPGRLRTMYICINNTWQRMLRENIFCCQCACVCIVRT